MDRSVLWWKVLGLAIFAEVLMVSIVFLYLVVYSYGIHPGEPERYYQEHVQTAAPYIAILAGLPVFYLLARWIAHWASALAFCGSEAAYPQIDRG